MRLATRIKSLTARVEVRPGAKSRPTPEDIRRQRNELLRHVPLDLQATMGTLLDTDPLVVETLILWLGCPFARWARPANPDYRLPRSLVEWMIAPPRAYWMGHHCERCGLGVPIFSTWANDPNPPSTVIAFPNCPACRGRTSFAASHQPGSEAEKCD
ncbi:MAG: hypothetical protein K8U57_28885 [Planctomycetes bacterium]|nr:hypothetical protein [Planctomycetota bacterium]